MSDYCYTHMPENALYCIECDLEDKKKQIAALEAENKDLELSRKFYREFYEETKADNERLRAALEYINRPLSDELTGNNAKAMIVCAKAALKGVDDE